MKIKDYIIKIRRDKYIIWPLRVVLYAFILAFLFAVSVYIRKTIIIHKLMSDTVTAYDTYMSEEDIF